MRSHKKGGLPGERYGKLVVIEEVATFYRRAVRCSCDCGREKTVTLQALRAGSTKSCGCLRVGTPKYQGGETESGEYRAWHSLKSRCLNPNDSSFKNYGGRGIYVCPRWVDSFEAFLADMGRRPTQDHSIDRIDNSGPYSKENCRWATQKQQQRNRRSNRIVTIDGVSKTLIEWAEFVGVRRGTLASRLMKGWAERDAIFRPARKITRWEPRPGRVIANQYARKIAQ